MAHRFISSKKAHMKKICHKNSSTSRTEELYLTAGINAATETVYEKTGQSAEKNTFIQKYREPAAGV